MHNYIDRYNLMMMIYAKVKSVYSIYLPKNKLDFFSGDFLYVSQEYSTPFKDINKLKTLTDTYVHA